MKNYYFNFKRIASIEVVNKKSLKKNQKFPKISNTVQVDLNFLNILYRIFFSRSLQQM